MRRLCADDPFGHRDLAILEMLYGTGIRASECVNLDMGDVDLRQGVLTIRRGKGRKDRLVPIPAQAKLAIERYLSNARPEIVPGKNETALFVSKDGGRLRAAGLRAMVMRRAKGAGISPRVYPHLLRHTYASHLIDGGADVRHVQELLGHESIDTTAVYTHVALADLERLIKRHPRKKRSAR